MANFISTSVLWFILWLAVGMTFVVVDRIDKKIDLLTEQVSVMQQECK